MTVVAGSAAEAKYHYSIVQKIWLKGPEYTVKHYKQSVEDTTKYDLIKTEGYAGVEGARTQAAAMTPDAGYTVRSFSQETIKADSTTVVNIYYDLIKYKVTFNNNGQGTAPAVQEVYYGGTAAKPADPVSTDYPFDGWYLNSTCTGDPYDFAAKVTGDITLYAKWGTVICTINFITNADIVPAPKNVPLSSSGTVQLVNLAAAEIPARDGYTFNGFYTQADGQGTCFYNAAGAGQKVEIKTGGTLNVYAYWTPAVFAVTLKNDTGDHTAVPETGTVTAKVGEELPKLSDQQLPKRTGYYFLGYYTEQNGRGTIYYDPMGNACRVVDIESVTTHKLGENGLYAHWYPKTRFMLTFDYQGGSGTVPKFYFNEDEEINNNNAAINASALPVKTNYDFAGFYSDVNGTGTQYYDASGRVIKPFNIRSMTVLFAYWKAKRAAISIDDRGGSGSRTQIIAYCGEAMPKLDPPAYAGYTFCGYFTEPEGKGKQIYDAGCQGGYVLQESDCTMGDTGLALTIYAYWTANKVSISFSANGGDGGPDTITGYACKTAPELPAEKGRPTRNFYIFKGYYDKQDASGKCYYDESLHATSEPLPDVPSIKLYAVWTPETREYALNANGGKFGKDASAPDKLTLSATYANPLADLTADQIPVRKDYTFTGFFAAVDSATGQTSGTQYYDSEGRALCAYDGTDNMYAGWNAKARYKLSFDNEGGDGVVRVYDFTEDDVINDVNAPASPTPIKQNYTFRGYFDQRDGAGKQYYDENGKVIAEFGITKDTVLYAYWTTIPVVISFDMQGGTGGTTELDTSYGSRLNSITAPKKTGYTFAGYYEGISETGKPQGKQYYGPDCVGGYLLIDDGRHLDKITVYAYWVAGSIAISFSSNGGTGGPLSATGNVAQPAPNIDAYGITIPTRQDYVFVGYFDTINETGGKQYYDENLKPTAELLPEAVSLKLYARWTRGIRDITLDGNGGFYGGDETKKSATVTAEIGKVLPPLTADQIPVETGYKFTGYYAEAGGGFGAGTQYYDADGKSSTICDISVTTLYAGWSAKAKYKLVFDKQGGSGPSMNFEFTEDDVINDGNAPVTILPTKSNYTFDGYYSEKNGAGTQYYGADGKVISAFSITKDTTLYANWKSTPVVISFDKQGGTGGTTELDTSYGSALPAVMPPVRSGYTFGGYYAGIDEVTGAPAGTQYYGPDCLGGYVLNDDGSHAAEITVYAYWTADKITISFHGNGGSGLAPSSIEGQCAAEPPVLGDGKAAPVRTGYTFGGYYDTSAATGGTQYYGADLAPVAGVKLPEKTTLITLYARWIAETKNVTLNGNGGSYGGDAAKTTVEISAVTDSTLPALSASEIPARKGYKFTGYYAEAGIDGAGAGKRYYDTNGKSGIVYDGSATTLYAGWSAKTKYKLTFDNQGGSGATAIYEFTEDDVINDNNAPVTAVPTKSNYTFGGYYSEKNGAGTQYYDASGKVVSAFSITKDTTLYAYWKAIPVKLVLNKNGGSGGPESTTLYYGDTLKAITPPVRAGYTFGGYYAGIDAATGAPAGTQYYGPDCLGGYVLNDDGRHAAEITVYAYWIEDKTSPSVMILYDQAGGSGGPSVMEGKAGDTAPALVDETTKAPIPAPTRTGYTFDGYYSEPDGAGKKYYAANENDPAGQPQSTAEVLPSGTVSLRLYANWKAVKYTLSLNKNADDAVDGAKTSMPAYYGEKLTDLTASDLPVRTGYTFGGFYTGNVGTDGICDLSGDQYYGADGISTRAYDRTEDITVYAKWIENAKVTILLDKQGGSDGTDEVRVETGKKPSENITAPVRENYSFLGYFTDIDGSGVKYFDADGKVADTAAEVQSDLTLYAFWKGEECKVELDDNGGSGGSGTVTFTYGSVIPNVRIPVREGYTFLGYFTSQTDGEGVQYYDFTGEGLGTSDVTKAMVDGGFKLYAQWVEDYEYVWLVFSQNGGSGGPSLVMGTGGDTAPALVDETTKAPIPAPTRTGYTFDGYYSEPDGAGTKYYAANETDPAGQPVPVSTAVIPNDTYILVLYANWIPIRYTLTLNKNAADAKDGRTSVDAYYGKKLTDLSAADLPTRAGYTFGGFFVEKDGSGVQFYGADGVNNVVYEYASDMNAYAYWVKNGKVSIFLNKQGGTDGDSVLQVEIGTKPSGSITAPSRDHYSFLGYFTEPGGNGVKYFEPDGSVAATAEAVQTDTTLYASWLGERHEVTLNNNGGSGGSGSATFIYGEQPPKVKVPVMSGYTFLGYFTSQTDGEGVQYYDFMGEGLGTSDITTDGVILYAQWMKDYNDIWILFDQAGGTGGPSMMEGKAGETAPELKDDVGTAILAPTLTGYTFDGYYSEPDGAGTKYYAANETDPAGQPVPVSTAVIPNDTYILVLYANWIPIRYTLSLNKNAADATDGRKSVDAYYGKKLTDLTASDLPVRTGFTFGGYYESIDTATGMPSGTQFYGPDGMNNVIYQFTSDKRAYAYWVEIGKVSIFLDKQGGTGGIDAVKLDIGSRPEAKITVPTRPGYEFNGYYTEADGSGDKYFEADGKVADTAAEVQSDLTLYAFWKGEKCEVELDDNGGSGGSGSVTFVYGEDIPNVKEPVREGYFFIGYYTSPDEGEGELYIDASGEGVGTSDVTKAMVDRGFKLYAQWVEDYEYVWLVFSQNGGSGGPSVIEGIAGGAPPELKDDAGIPIMAPVREGYIFDGYSTSPDFIEEGPDIKYYEAGTDPAGQPVPVSTAVIPNDTYILVLYANWIPIRYTLTLNKNADDAVDGAKKSVDAYYGEYLEDLSAAELPTRAGYTFGGFFGGMDGSGVQFYGADGINNVIYELAHDAVAYAYWVETGRVSIVLDKQGGTGGDSVLQIETGTVPSAAVSIPVRTGYDFLGYYTEAGGAGTQYFDAAGEVALAAGTVLSDMTLYAAWKAHTTTITLDMQGGTGGAVSVNAEYGSKAPSVGIPSRSGYIFGGYFTELGGQGGMYYAADGISYVPWDIDSQTVKLYALWIENIKPAPKPDPVPDPDPVPEPVPVPDPPAPNPIVRPVDGVSGGGGSSGGGGTGRSGSIAGVQNGPLGNGLTEGEWRFIPDIMVGEGLRVIDGTAYIPRSGLPGTTGYRPDGIVVRGSWQFLINGVPYNKGWLHVYNPYAIVELGQNDSGWFYFGEDTLMKTGWYTDSVGSTFYLNTTSDNTLGEMAIGWRKIDGRWHFFEDGSGSSLESSLGVMHRSDITPDGYKVDADGVWVE
ncbi:MAG: InlB B-repeat-containing protein [Eubacteriales bacterium]|nr:InlB B-repeat-containing protein [Eubacteriales bacterium]